MRLISIDQVRVEKPFHQIRKIMQHIDDAIRFCEFRVNEVEPAILAYEVKLAVPNHSRCCTAPHFGVFNISNSIDALGVIELLIHREVRGGGVSKARHRSSS
jgi:hypothetical protein